MAKNQLISQEKFHGPLVQLCVTIPNSAISKVLTDGNNIHNRITEHNIKHFSSAESSSLGLHSLLHTTIGPHGTSDFCDRVLSGCLGEADKTDINFTEAYELLQHMAHPPTATKQRSPTDWILDSIDKVLHSNTTQEAKPEEDSTTPTTNISQSGHTERE